MRARQRVRVALSKGETIPSEDYGTAQKVLEQVVWYLPATILWVVVFFLWFGLFLFGTGTFRWTAVLWMFASGVWAWTLLRRRKRILAGATKMGFRRVG